MREWFRKRKAFIIFMGVVFVLLSLLLLPAFARAPYENALVGGEYFGKGTLNVFFSVTGDIAKNLQIAFSEGLSYYLDALKVFGAFYLIFTICLLIKMSAKKDYQNI